MKKRKQSWLISTSKINRNMGISLAIVNQEWNLKNVVCFEKRCNPQRRKRRFFDLLMFLNVLLSFELKSDIRITDYYILIDDNLLSDDRSSKHSSKESCDYSKGL